jgi:hypothetical protein
MSIFEVWKIDKIRDNYWILKLDQKFNDIQNAKKHIVSKSMIVTDINLFLNDIKRPEEKEEFVNNFCFGESYIQYQHYFLGRPNIKTLSMSVETRVIIV